MGIRQNKMAKILIIDDEPTVLKAMEEAVLSQGYQVVCAVDGEDGYEKALNEPPDLIITDLILPKMDGWRVCQKIKSDAKMKSIPILITSAFLGDESPVKSGELGDAYIAKPFKSINLLNKIRELLKEPSAKTPNG
jgi:DNA-binding response OmpR family regulator